MKISRMIISLLFVALLSLPATAQDKEKTRQAIDELARKTAHITSYRVDTKIETSAMGQEIVSNGTMAFKEPGLMHMTTNTEMMGGMRQEVFKTGDLVWGYMPVMKIVTKVDLARLKEALPNQQDYGDDTDISEMLKNVPEDAITFIEKKNIEGNEVYVFELSPEHLKQDMASPQQNFPMPQKVEVLAYAENGLPYQVRAFGKDGVMMMKQTYTNYQLNVSIPDSEFSFTPPEGVQVMDLTEATINMMNQLKQPAGQPQPVPAE